jgi:hypothetical protein
MRRLYKVYFILCIIAGIMGLVAIVYFVGKAFLGIAANQPGGPWYPIVLSVSLCIIAFIIANVYREKLKD